ncbi:MAG: aminotransferase class IV [Bacteroidia bacterium]
MPHGTHNALPDDRNEHILISVNGELFPRQEAKVSVFDSGYLVGDGVWEAFRLHHGQLVFIEEHLKRLWWGAETIGLELPFNKSELKQQIRAVIEANQMSDGVHIRLMVTRGNKKTPSQDPRLTISPPNVVIIPEYKSASQEKGISLYTASIRRAGEDFLDARLNCHSKLHEVIALNQALNVGADEALMLDPHGYVATCNATNFFIVTKGEVWTSQGKYCMNGITRSKVIELCQSNNISCKQRDFTLDDVYNADQAFVTGTFGGLTSVHTVDNRPITNRGIDLVSQLRTLYASLIQQEIKHEQ